MPQPICLCDEPAWQSLLNGLRQGDAVAVLRFHHRLTPNIEWLLRRYSVIHSRRFAREICHEAVLNLQSGKLNSQSEIGCFLRERIRQLAGVERKRVVRTVPDLGKCDSKEAELAIRYYVLTQDQEEICRCMDLSPEAFVALKKAAREIFRNAALRRQHAEELKPIICAS